MSLLLMSTCTCHHGSHQVELCHVLSYSYCVTCLRGTCNQCYLVYSTLSLRLVLQFSLLNGSIHDSWLQQGHEGLRMDEETQARCEVLACQKPPPAEAGRKKAVKTAEVYKKIIHVMYC